MPDGVVLSAKDKLIAQAMAGSYTLEFARGDNGTGTLTLYKDGIAIFTTSGGWDDTTPWASGDYLASKHDSQKHPVSWRIDGIGGGRSGILLHETTSMSSKDSQGCLLVSAAALATIRAEVGTAPLHIKVINDFPVQLTLDNAGASSSISEGGVVSLRVNLNQSVSKDIWVRVDFDQNGAVTSGDLTPILSGNFQFLTGKLNESASGSSMYFSNGWYVKIAAGQTSATVDFRVNPDGQAEGSESVHFTLKDYMIQYRPNRFYGDLNLNNISKSNSFEDVTIADQTYPFSVSGSSGLHPYTLNVSAGQVISYSFNAYTIPDLFRITDGTNVLLDTGMMSNIVNGSVTIASTTSGKLDLVVEGNVNTGTIWDLTMNLVSSAAAFSFASPSGGGEPVQAAQPPKLVPVPGSPLDDSIDVSNTEVGYTLTGEAGNTYLIQVVGKDAAFDPTLRIEDETAAIVANVNDRLGGNSPFVFLTPDALEYFGLYVGGADGSTGAYQIHVDDITGSTASVFYVTINNSLVEEGPDGAETLITVYRDGDLSTSQTVSWQITGNSSGSTVADLKGLNASGTITFAPGAYAKTVQIEALLDSLAEGQENFSFTLSGANINLAPADVFGASSNVNFVVVDSVFLPQSKTGEAGPDDLVGGPLNDILKGVFGNDLLHGLDGDDTLNGGPGVDVLDGGSGTDLADYTGATAGIKVDLAFGLGSFGDAEGDTLMSIENVNGTGYDDELYGDGLANILRAGGGNDIINGGGGADIMGGGKGNDLYVIDNAGDSVVEAANAGTDTVWSFLTWAMSSNVENLTLIGASAVNATGNGLANSIIGNAAANDLDGAAGGDFLAGGGGNDTYRVDNALDSATENLNEGVDTVIASRSWAVTSNIEKVFLTGSGDFNVAGNGLANELRGNSGDNWLNGSFGNDRLTGGGGRDSFIFNRTLGANNIDTITDYDVARDVMRIDNAVFAGIGAAGALAGGAFNVGASATEADDRIIYDSATGKLYFDIDGLGGQAQQHFATLANKPVGLASSEFIVI